MENTLHIISNNGDYQLIPDNRDCTSGKFEGGPFALDITETPSGFHVLKDGKSHTVDIIKFDPAEKSVRLRINHKFYDFKVRDRYDELLEKLGMHRGSAGKVSSIRAPMPGLVLDIMIAPGDKVEVNQPLIILEAMKMENVIKSPTENVVKKIEITKGESVEKNQVLVEFN